MLGLGVRDVKRKHRSAASGSLDSPDIQSSPIKMVQDKKLPAVTIILDHQFFDTKSY